MLHEMDASFELEAPVSRRHLLSPIAVASMPTTWPWPSHQKQIGTSWMVAHVGPISESILALTSNSSSLEERLLWWLLYCLCIGVEPRQGSSLDDLQVQCEASQKTKTNVDYQSVTITIDWSLLWSEFLLCAWVGCDSYDQCDRISRLSAHCASDIHHPTRPAMMTPCFLHYWPFVREIHWLPVDSPHKGTEMQIIDFFLCSPEHAVEQTADLQLILGTMMLMSHHYL